MKHSLRGTAAVAVGLALAGCIQFEQKLTLMTDGSGKVEYTIAVKAEGGFGPGGQEDPFEDAMNPDEIEKQVKGIVAWTLPVFEEKEGWKRVKLTGYFEDINKVQMLEGGEVEEGNREVEFAFELKQDAAGSTLTIRNPSSKQELERLKEFDKGMPEPIRAIFKGMKLSMEIAAPGKITEAKEFKVDGKVARLEIGDEVIFGAMEAKEQATKRLRSLQGDVQVRWGPADDAAARAAAEFKKELAAAKANWPKVRAEMKREFENRKKNAPKDDEEGGEGDGRPPMGKDR